MRNRKVTGIAAALLSLAIPAFAAGPGWTVPSTVVEVVATANGGVNIRLSPDLTGCVAQSGYGSMFASVYPSNLALKNIKADALLAFATGAHLALYLNDNQCTVLESRLMQ